MTELNWRYVAATGTRPAYLIAGPPWAVLWNQFMLTPAPMRSACPSKSEIDAGFAAWLWSRLSEPCCDESPECTHVLADGSGRVLRVPCPFGPKGDALLAQPMPTEPMPTEPGEPWQVSRCAACHGSEVVAVVSLRPARDEERPECDACSGKPGRDADPWCTPCRNTGRAPGLFIVGGLV